MTKLFQHYDERALRFGDHYRAVGYRFKGSFFERLRSVKEKLEGMRGCRILDVGCGAGLLTAWLTESNQVIGLDPSMGMLRLAEQKFLKPVLGEGSHLPFKTGSFDAVLCMETIQHIQDPFPFLEEIARVTIPGGVTIISSLSQESFFQKVLWQLGITKRNLFFHDRGAFERFLKRKSITRQEIHFLGFPLPLRWPAEKGGAFFSSSWVLSGRKEKEK